MYVHHTYVYIFQTNQVKMLSTCMDKHCVALFIKPSPFLASLSICYGWNHGKCQAFVHWYYEHVSRLYITHFKPNSRTPYVVSKVQEG